MKKLIITAFCLIMCAAAAISASAADFTVRYYRDEAHTDEIAASDIKVGDTVFYAVTPEAGRAVSLVETNLSRTLIGTADGHTDLSNVSHGYFISSLPGDEITFDCETVMAGDIDGDGEVNPKDVTVYMQSLMDNTPMYWTYIGPNAASDVFADGKRDLKDVATLMKVIAGWDVIPCAGEAKDFALYYGIGFEIITSLEVNDYPVVIPHFHGYGDFCEKMGEMGIAIPEWLDFDKYSTYNEVRYDVLCGVESIDGLTYKYYGNYGVPGTGPAYKDIESGKKIAVIAGLY